MMEGKTLQMERCTQRKTEGNQSKPMASKCELTTTNPRSPGIFFSFPTGTRLSGCQAPD